MAIVLAVVAMADVAAAAAAVVVAIALHYCIGKNVLNCPQKGSAVNRTYHTCCLWQGIFCRAPNFTARRRLNKKGAENQQLVEY